MPAPAPVLHRIDDLLRSPDLFVPSGAVVDLLLDVRNDTGHAAVRDHVDRDLRMIGARHVLTSVEVQIVLDRLVPVLRLAESSAASSWARTAR